ncbi:hypothetical protein HAX54_024590 [Datura stramonium]|uniref:Oberon coiled-coil region domain-containing protein n=1 Tax=Datura stramonium TaxID=4076 RepID=A0ABS8UZJ0_DATST|nr:hypothetical protein [Datura stramonium]
MRQDEKLTGCRIALAKSGNLKKIMPAATLNSVLSEAEAEKQFLFEKIKLQDQSSRSSQGNDIGDTSYELYTKIQEILKIGTILIWDLWT